MAGGRLGEPWKRRRIAAPVASEMGEIHATGLELLGEAAAVGDEAVTTSFSDSGPVVTDDPARTSLPRSSSSIQLPAVAAEDQVFVPSDPGSGFDHLGDIQRSHARIGGEAATDDPFPSFGSLTSFAGLSSFQRSSTLAIAAKVEAFEQPGSTAQDFSPVGVVAATLVPAVAAKDQAFGASSPGSGLRGIQSHAAISGEAATGDYGPVATDDPTSLSASDSNVQVWKATQDFSLGEIADAIVRNYFDGKLPRDSARPAEAIMHNYFDGTPSWDSDRAQVSPVRMTPASLGDLYGRLEFYQMVRVAQAVEMVAYSFGDFHEYRSWHPWAFEEAHQFSGNDDPTMVEVENQFSRAEGELPRDDDNDTVSKEGDLHMEEVGEEDEHLVIEVEDHAGREEEKDQETGEEDDVDGDEFAQIKEGPRVDDAQCDGLESKDDEAVEIQVRRTSSLETTIQRKSKFHGTKLCRSSSGMAQKGQKVLAHQLPQDDDLVELQISWDEAVQELLRDGTERSEGVKEVREEDKHAVIEAEDHAAREEEEDNKAGEVDNVDEDEFAQIEEDVGVDDAQCDRLENEAEITQRQCQKKLRQLWNQTSTNSSLRISGRCLAATTNFSTICFYKRPFCSISWKDDKGRLLITAQCHYIVAKLDKKMAEGWVDKSDEELIANLNKVVEGIPSPQHAQSRLSDAMRLFDLTASLADLVLAWFLIRLGNDEEQSLDWLVYSEKKATVDRHAGGRGQFENLLFFFFQNVKIFDPPSPERIEKLCAWFYVLPKVEFRGIDITSAARQILVMFDSTSFSSFQHFIAFSLSLGSESTLQALGRSSLSQSQPSKPLPYGN
ncbi:hypothetical protein SELMODRAFT_428610 [Selaginella moellendorffii]|uniref:Uncharacterized protein n=1 Tax=Selaginella moellendorffii TaxID=88036 RepID=D8T3E8_SELML|nr:hypothetical protein SELMODRAFT_428610 [Selaginella moellendorffii]